MLAQSMVGKGGHMLARNGAWLCPAFASKTQLLAVRRASSTSKKFALPGSSKPADSPSSSSLAEGSRSSTSYNINAPASSSSTSSHANALRSRKLTPTAKAKAQASASRALREQLQATKSTTLTGLDPTAAAEGETEAVYAAIIADKQAKDTAQQGKLQAAGITPAEQRSAAAPAPVRQIRDVFAYATAEAYDFDVLVRSGRLPLDWQFMQDGDVIYIPQWPPRAFSAPTAPTPTTTTSSSPKESSFSFTPLHASSTASAQANTYTPGVGEAFIFRSGSYVTWGISEEQSRKFTRSIIRGRPHQGGSAELGSYSEIGDEAMEYVMADDQITRVVGDVIVIGQQPKVEEGLEGEYIDANAAAGGQAEDPDWSPLLARLAFSQGLCRSARLSVQEAALSAYLEEVADMPARLEAEGKVPLPRRQVIRKMGTLLKLRQRANLDTENFLDDPEMYWENGELEHHYDSICAALDIETRFKAYNEKLDHGENLLGVLRALLTEASTHRMELIIIYLIAFEVCLALISHEYIPSPERVYKFVAETLLGQTAQVHDADTTAAATAAISSSSSKIRQRDADHQSMTYWQWLSSYVPGLRRSNVHAATGESASTKTGKAQAHLV